MKFLVLFMTAVLIALPQARAAEEYPGNSVFHLRGDWQDQDGKRVTLGDLKGRVSAVALVYTSCQYSCPLIIEEFGKIKAKLSPAALQKTSFVLISMDPKRDTPAALKIFAAKRKLDLSLWRLLTAASERPVREFSAVIGANIKKTGDDFAHSNLITVLDTQGVIAFTKMNIGQQVDETAAAINKFAAK
ncbi:MAG TPA: SCO family protein [Bdellovibrionales bacterium]|nr:SCO family protein [Bdellovibrionales bacterium]